MGKSSNEGPKGSANLAILNGLQCPGNRSVPSAQARLLRFRQFGADPVKKEGQRRIQCSGRAHERGNGNAVLAELIFLDLLEGDAENLSQLSLAHSERLTSGAQPLPDDNVHRIKPAVAFVLGVVGSAAADR